MSKRNDSQSIPRLFFSLLRLIFLCLSLCLLLSPSVWAQIEIGKLTGTVMDPSGARVLQADVSLINHLTGRQIRTTTDTQGQFRIDNIPYGPYILRVTAPGF